MGTPSSRKHKKSNKGRKKLMKGKRYKRSDDQVIDDIMANSASFVQKRLEEDGVSVNDFEYCIICSKYFSSLETLNIHERTKAHKRRVKFLMKKPYSHDESRRAGGFGSYPIDFFNPIHLDALKVHMSDPIVVVGKRNKKSSKKCNGSSSLVDSIQKMML